MRDRKETGSHFGKIKIVLIILSIFAAVKMLFFAFGLDEEYQLVMAYRNVRGDKLFLSMWEPHQTSAFLCSLLMRPYLALVGNTGVVIWLRLCGTLIHLGVSCYLCRVLGHMVSRESAFLLGLIYFNTIPKQIMLPEFGIMQAWFLTLLSLFLLQYYDCAGGAGDSSVRRRKYLVLAAFALVLEALSYPSCVLVYFPVLWIIWRRSGKRRLADMGIVTGICSVCAVSYLGLLLKNNTPDGLLRTVSYIVNGDITHSLTVADKLLALAKDMLLPAVLCLGIFFLAKAGTFLTMRMRGKRRGEVGEERAQGSGRTEQIGAAESAGKGEEERTKEREKAQKNARRGLWLLWTAALSLLAELWYWVVRNAGYESMQIHLVVFAVLGIGYYFGAAGRSGRLAFDIPAVTAGGLGIRGEEREGTDKQGREASREESMDSRRQLQSGLLLDGICLAGVSLLAVLYLTDLGLMDSLPHAMTAAFFGMALVVMYWERGGEPGGAEKKILHENVSGDRACVSVVLVLWALTAIFGKGYTLRSGTGYHNVLQSGGILKYGPAAGTLSDYMCAYIYNCDYEDWQSMIQDGDRVLIMVDQVMNLGTIQYLFQDVEISHYSIVNPTAYDERLKEYWEMFPGKQPNVIIVDDWYGQLMTDPDGWLMRYAEGEFGYTSVEQGRYIRVYRRD